MSYLDTVVNVNISATSATVSLPGTNIPAIIGYHTHNTDKIRTYYDLAGMVSDGFSTTEPLYLMAQSIVQQNPRPSSFRVIRGTTAVAQTATFTVVDTNVGETIGFTLTSPTGVEWPITYTVPSTKTTTEIATALAALSDPSGVTITSSGAVVTVTVTAAGTVWHGSDFVGGLWADTTTTTAPGTDLDAALLVDNSWYGISGEWKSAAIIKLIADWAETNKKAHFYTTDEGLNLTSGTGVMDTIRDLSYARSVGLYSETSETYGATGWMAAGLVKAPGSYNFAYKTIKGTAVDTLSPTHQAAIIANNGNFYTDMAGASVTIDGRAASGLFIDITIGIDGLTSNIQTRIANLLVTLPKLPYTRKGMGMVKAEVSAALQDSVRDGFVTDESGFEYTVSIPDLAQVSSADKASRTLRNVNFVAYAQGAVNKVQINGTVNV